MQQLDKSNSREISYLTITSAKVTSPLIKLQLDLAAEVLQRQTDRTQQEEGPRILTLASDSADKTYREMRKIHYAKYFVVLVA